MLDYPRDPAFSKILTELQNLLVRTNTAINQATQDNRYSDIALLADQAQGLQKIIQDVEAISGKCSIAQRPPAPPPVATPRPTRPRRGEITPQEAYRIPILKALVQMGGSGRTHRVIDHVRRLMDRTLQPKDFEEVGTTYREPRWRNATKWCRNTLKDERLLEGGSPHGTWEITEKGRNYLKGNGPDRPTILRGD